MLADLEAGGALTDPRVEDAMAAVPRHLFVPAELTQHAYEDRPLPVGLGQTISAPHMVAMMTAAAMVEPGDNVLEIGTGRGYHAAILAHMVGPEGHVTSVEFMPELAEAARSNLAAAEADVTVVVGDGADGYEANAPYDVIVVTCAMPRVPDALLWQVRDGGHMVIPVGRTQCKLLAGKVHDGDFRFDELLDCLFVNAQGRLAHDPDVPAADGTDDDDGPHDGADSAGDDAGSDDDSDDDSDEDGGRPIDIAT